MTNAERLLKTGSVRILVDKVIPPEAILVVGKGLGFVPTSAQNPIEIRLDARRVAKRLTQYANKKDE